MLKECTAFQLLEQYFSDQKMAYLNINGDPELSKVKTKGDQLKELQCKTEKHDNENILKSHKIDNDCLERINYP